MATLANDLNPVAALVLKGHCRMAGRNIGPSIRAPATSNSVLIRLTQEVREPALCESFSQTEPHTRVQKVFELKAICGHARLPAHTVKVLVSLSPNWRLAPDGTGVRLNPYLGKGPG